MGVGHDGSSVPPRVLVVGAGPAGLASAACLGREGVAFRLVDRRGVAGGAYQSIYPGVTLASPGRYVDLPELEPRFEGEYVTASEVRAYLERYALHHHLSPEQAEVLGVERSADRLAVRFAGGEVASFDALVVATGMFDHPVRPEIPGLPPDGPAAAGRPEVLHAKAWPGPQAFDGKHVLVVGAATSGIEIAEECCRAHVRVTVSARGGKVKIFPQRVAGRDAHDFAYLFEKVPRWLLGSYCDRRPTLPGTDLGFSAFRKRGLVDVRPETVQVDGREVVFKGGARQAFDALVLATGYTFEMPFLPAEVARSKAGHPLADHGLSRSWPGLYFVGTPCAASLSSEFLRGIHHDAIAVARRIQAQLGG